MAPFTHIIAFRYRQDATADEIRVFEQTFLDLERSCVTDDGKPYINVRGGKNVFKGPLGHEMQSVFVVDFRSKEDEAYFHEKDQAHRAFIPIAQGMTTDAVILDFAPF